MLGLDRDPPEQRLSATLAQEPERLVEAPLASEARRVAVRFIQTAVARENLEEAGARRPQPARRAEQAWLTGENPVVPYPIDELDHALQGRRAGLRHVRPRVALLLRKGSASGRRCSSWS